MVTEEEIHAAMRDLHNLTKAAEKIVSLTEACRRVNLRELRRERGLTQAKLSELTGVCAPEISFFECGKRPLSIRNAKRLAEFFGIRWTAFFD